MKAYKKELDSELNLISFISLLSVLICSLLLTAIWVHIGSMNVKQAVGGQATEASTKKTPALWAKMRPDGSVKFHLQDFPRAAKKLHNQQVAGIDGKVDTKAIGEYVDTLKSITPDLRMALLQPQAEVVYEEIISLMDGLKQKGLVDLGVAPL